LLDARLRHDVLDDAPPQSLKESVGKVRRERGSLLVRAFEEKRPWNTQHPGSRNTSGQKPHARAEKSGLNPEKGLPRLHREEVVPPPRLRSAFPRGHVDVDLPREDAPDGLRVVEEKRGLPRDLQLRTERTE